MDQPAPPVQPRQPRKSRGRPRQFDVERAVVQAHALFDARGYDRVSLADLTGVMGINPPSFYAAFGCKAMLFARVLDGYSAALLDQVRAAFADERASNAALADILLMAAHSYAPAPAEGSAPARRGGCLILEAGLNCSDAIVAEYIRKARLALAAILYRGIAKDQPERAAMLTDYMLMQLAGLSAMARDGTAHDRLYSAAQMAGRALTALPDQ